MPYQVSQRKERHQEAVEEEEEAAARDHKLAFLGTCFAYSALI